MLLMSTTLLQVDIHAGLLHDAILAWAYGVNKTIGADLSKVDNGRAITSNIINMTFNGRVMNVEIYLYSA